MKTLFVCCGDPDDFIRSRHGRFVDWFRAGVGEHATLHEVDARTDSLTPAHLDGFDALMISGSAHAAYEPHPWIPALEETIREAVLVREMPVLGVCFGHQVVAQALGGKVVRNPRGREIGTAWIRPNEDGRASALLAGLGDPFPIQLTHCDTVAKPPPGARVLATSEKDDCQAFTVGSAWCVQFHPEITHEVIRSYVQSRREIITNEGLDVNALLDGIRETDAGPELFRRFVAFARESVRGLKPTASKPLR